MHNSTTVKLPDVAAQDIAANVKALRESFNSGALKDVSARKTVLKQLQTLMKEGETAMKEAMWKDLHKHPTESYLGEIALVNAEIQDHLDYIDDWTKPELAATNLANLPGLSYIHRDPLGVVCVIGTWNYPVNLLFVPLIAAIAAGNCALVRLPGDDTTKHLNNVLIELFDKYIDARFVRYVYGGVEETKAMLSEKYDLIFATGGCFLGKIVAKAAAETLTPTILELGGKSPVIVDDSADLALAARRIAWGAFSNAGQTCVRPDYVLVDAKVGDKFVKLLEETIHTFYGSDPKTSDGYGRVVNERSYARLHAMLDEDRKHVTFGGDSDASDKYIHPTLFNFKTDFATFTSSAVMSQELFGPLLPIYYYGSGNLSMPIEFITSKDKPLALYHFTTNDKNKKRVIRDTSAGSMMVNDTMMQLTNPHVPFGGVGNSGMGAYHGKFGFEAFSHRKPVIHKYSLLDLPQRYAPYTPASERVLRIVQYPFSRAFFRSLKLAGYAFVLALMAIGIKKAGLDDKVLGMLKIEQATDATDGSQSLVNSPPSDQATSITVDLQPGASTTTTTTHTETVTAFAMYSAVGSPNKSSKASPPALPDVKQQDIAENVRVLRSSFATGATRDIALRKQLLKQLRNLLHDGEPALKEALWKDLHKHPTETYAAELSLLYGEIQDHLDQLDDWANPERVTTNIVNLPGLSYIKREPLGIVCIFGTWNYPANLLLTPLIAAISAGNCVLMRLAGEDTTMHFNNVLIGLLDKHIDSRYIRYVYGGIQETQEMLSEKFDLIFATGGSFLGKIVAKAAAETLTPIVLELGGKTPTIIDASADIALAARRIGWGAFINSGQTCVRPDYILVDASVGDQFVKALQDIVHEFYGQDPKRSEFYGRVINSRAYDRLSKLLEANRKHVTFGGESDEKERYFAPTIFNFKTDFQAFERCAVMQEEVFGPLLPVYYYEPGNLSFAIDFVTAREKPLALYVFSTTSDNKQRVMNETSAGSMMVNDTMMQLSNSHVPFGGVGSSGMGAYHGKFGFEAFSHRKAVIYKYSMLDLPQRYPPYTPASERILRIVQYPFSRAQVRIVLLVLLTGVVAIVAAVVGA